MTHRFELVAPLAVLAWAAFLLATAPAFLLGIVAVALLVPLLFGLPLLVVAGATEWLERESPRSARTTLPAPDGAPEC